MDVVNICGASKTYSGKRAVDDLRMTVPQGAIYGFVGRNGAGKSTAMKLIAGLASPDDGGVEVFGRPVNARAGARQSGGIVQRVGVLIENPGILPNMNAMDNMMALALALGVPKPRKACADLLSQVGLSDTGRKRAKGFSLGMKQRLGLAMALLGGPDLLLLDEPLNGLDPEAARDMRNYLVQLNRTRGITIVISSHVLDQLFAYARANDPDRRPEIETIAVHPLLAEILLGHYPEFEERGWEPAVSFGDESLTVDADRAAMGRIIENLVSNTLRYGAAAPSIVQERSRITFSNAVDTATATGLDLDRMFHRFYQADGARSGSGSGLGLAVARSLAESMGMQLYATMDGITLSITLDLGPAVHDGTGPGASAI